MMIDKLELADKCEAQAGKEQMPNEHSPELLRRKLISPRWQFWRKRYAYWYPCITKHGDEWGADGWLRVKPDRHILVKRIEHDEDKPDDDPTPFTSS